MSRGGLEWRLFRTSVGGAFGKAAHLRRYLSDSAWMRIYPHFLGGYRTRAENPELRLIQTKLMF